MKHATLSVLMSVLSLLAWAQTETFDIVTYQVPMGWKKQQMESAMGFSKVDQVTGTWCQIGIYNSVASSGNPANDFSGEWKQLVKPETYSGALEPKPTITVNEWNYAIGASAFKWQGKDATILLENISGFGTMVSIVVSMNSDKYLPEVEKFLKSLQLKKPVQQQQQSSPVTQQQSQQAVQTQSAQTAVTATSATTIKVTDERGVHGIQASVTNFNDGWTSEPYADYVKVTKGSTTVLLHYAIQIDDEARQASSMATVYWARLIPQRYRVGNTKVFANEPYTYFKTYFMEGDAVELSTNKSCYVCLKVLVSNGVATCIEVRSASVADFNREFPTMEKVDAMLGYNKFAVSATDIVGEWSESSSMGVNMYNSYTGAYAGMNTSAMANSWKIKSGGLYESEHKGAYGMVGSQTFYDQKYKGNWKLGAWDITMTNRFEGKTNVYDCEYQAVRGGRMLYLRDKEAKAMEYRLVKVK